MMFQKTTKVRVLFDGSKHEYDLCSQQNNNTDLKKFRYIGKGIIDTINGINQGYSMSKEEHYRYFYTRI